MTKYHSIPRHPPPSSTLFPPSSSCLIYVKNGPQTGFPMRVCLCVGLDRAYTSLKATAITNGPLVAFPCGTVEPYPQSRQLTCIRLLGSAAVAVVLLVVSGGERTDFNSATKQSRAGRGHLFRQISKATVCNHVSHHANHFSLIYPRYENNLTRY